MLEEMYRIAWLCYQTVSNGEYCLTRKQAEAWIEHLDKSHPGISHWIEEA